MIDDLFGLGRSLDYQLPRYFRFDIVNLVVNRFRRDREELLQVDETRMH